jgi:hypothetical protein
VQNHFGASGRALDDRPGAKFVARFVKNRNATDADCPPLEWRFLKTPGQEKANVTWKLISGSELFRQCIEDGLSTASEIAQEMSISRGQPFIQLRRFDFRHPNIKAVCPGILEALNHALACSPARVGDIRHTAFFNQLIQVCNFNFGVE